MIASVNPGWFALGLAALSFVWTEWRVRSRRQRRLALGPTPDRLRQRLVEVRNLLLQVVAAGGEDASWFLAAERKLAGKHLGDEARRVGDTELKRLTNAAAQAWDETYAAAPPEAKPLVFWGAPDPESRREAADQARRMETVTGIAEAGAAKCEAALDRLNELERSTPDV